jgi:NAD dependent epimerase/dehydratase family enzyme
MADGLLLASTRVRPAALEQAGYTFRSPDLETALKRILGR